MSTISFLFGYIIILSLLAIAYNKKFLLSILLCLERILLLLLIFNMVAFSRQDNLSFLTFSIFILTLRAVEARIGISLLTLISRYFDSTSIQKFKSLKK